MESKHYKNWISIEDWRRCKPCEEEHGKIYEMDEIPYPDPPLHERCRCVIKPMKAILAREATSRGKNGAGWWLLYYQTLPPYYITGDQAKALGWNPRRNCLSTFAPGKTVTMGEYGNFDGHLPSKAGRTWYEADIDYDSGKRNKKRVIYSNDGLLFVSFDHYRTFAEIVQ